MTQDDIYTLIGSLGIVPVVNIENPEKAERLALSLIEGGIPCKSSVYHSACSDC